MKMLKLTNFVGEVMDRNYDVIIFFLNILISSRPGVANFADIIKFSVILIKTSYDHGKNVVDKVTK